MQKYGGEFHSTTGKCATSSTSCGARSDLKHSRRSSGCKCRISTSTAGGSIAGRDALHLNFRAWYGAIWHLRWKPGVIRTVLLYGGLLTCPLS